jgi:hypothetical protein
MGQSVNPQGKARHDRNAETAEFLSQAVRLSRRSR